jgi:hypothetical protein
MEDVEEYSITSEFMDERDYMSVKDASKGVIVPAGLENIDDCCNKGEGHIDYSVKLVTLIPDKENNLIFLKDPVRREEPIVYVIFHSETYILVLDRWVPWNPITPTFSELGIRMRTLSNT